MNYKATVHTLEVEPLLPGIVSKNKWIKEVYDMDKPYARAKWNSHSELRLFVNPHKTRVLDDGRFHFEYDGLTRHREIMQNICKELNMDGYIIRRFDVCLDTDQPYERTAKITRLIVLLLADKIKEDNRKCTLDRYCSFDPLTFEPETTRIQNGDRKTKTLEAEHYNRAVVDQKDYDTTVVNRFELRAMGRQAGMDHDERTIVENWIKRLQSLDSADLSGLTSTLNAGIFSGWEAYAESIGKQNRGTAFNNFLRFSADHIYTQEQLKDLFKLFGKSNPERAASDLKQRSGDRFKSMFTRREIRLATKQMIDALTEFISS